MAEQLASNMASYVMGGSGSEGGSDGGWIGWYCGLKGNELLLEVDEDYIADTFNLYGLKSRFTWYDCALDQILSCEAPDEDDIENPQFHEIYQDAAMLYGLIHARFLITPRGLGMAAQKYRNGDWGYCPRVMCGETRVVHENFYISKSM